MALRFLSNTFIAHAHEAGDDPSGLTLELRARVLARVTTFFDAFDLAMASPTAESLNDLYDATDQVTRATGRVLVELALLSNHEEFR
jgi:hypothetical protein